MVDPDLTAAWSAINDWLYRVHGAELIEEDRAELTSPLCQLILRDRQQTLERVQEINPSCRCGTHLALLRELAEVRQLLERSHAST